MVGGGSIKQKGGHKHLTIKETKKGGRLCEKNRKIRPQKSQGI